jgi:hypothetical protein
MSMEKGNTLLRRMRQFAPASFSSADRALMELERQLWRERMAHRIAPGMIVGIDPGGPDNPIIGWNIYEQNGEPITTFSNASGELADIQSFFGYGLPQMERVTAVAEMPAPVQKPERESILRREAVRPEDVAEHVDAMQAELATAAEALLGYSVMRKRLRLPNPLLAALEQLEIEPFDGETVRQYQKEMLAYAQYEAARLDAAEGIPAGSFQARRADWRVHKLEGYSKPVPEFALKTALRIKRACPQAQFHIEELEAVPDPFLIVSVDNTRRYVEVWDEPRFERIGEGI